jgi:hypothetical protein
MPVRVLEFYFSPLVGETEVKRAFVKDWAGSEANWRWLKEKLSSADPAELKDLCVPLDSEGLNALELLPCVLIGWLGIENEEAWWRGYERGSFSIVAVVHEFEATAYLDAEIARIKEAKADAL